MAQTTPSHDPASSESPDDILALGDALLQAAQARKVADHNATLARERYNEALAAYRAAFDRQQEAA